MAVNEIRKRILLRAPRNRVWEALTDSHRFGTWFGCEFDEPFEVGARVRGRVVPTKVDAAVAKAQEAYAGVEFDVVVDRIDPMTHFSFRWHPGDAVPETPHPDGEMTTVTFEIVDADGGVLLTIVESGFEGIPLERRAKVFEMNEGGWEAQTKLIEAYLRDAA